jgi:lysozyme
MSTAPSFYLDPNRILSCPSEWTELSLNQALLRSRFLPVVSIFPVGSTLQAQMLQNFAMNPFTCTPLPATARFFTQVAQNQSTAAQGPVPTAMDISADGAKFIQGWESVGGYDKAKGLYFPYDDKDPHAKPIVEGQKVKGFPTIGYGHLIASSEDFSKGLTSVQIDKLFVQDAAPRIKGLNSILKVRVSQQQFDALLAFEFNTSSNGKLTVPPIKKLNAGKAVAEHDFTAHYVTSGGVVMPGLKKRRTSEWVLFSKGNYDSRH